MKSLVGFRYGKLTVIERGEDYIQSNGNIAVRYICQCDCGRRTLTRAVALKSGKVKSCGCSRKDALLTKNVIDMQGKRYGSWTVVLQLNSNNNREAVWLCECDCGNKKEFTRRALVKGYGLKCNRCKNSNSDEAVIALKTELLNQRFNRWTVVEYAGVRKSKKNNREYRQWKCVCDCGNVAVVDECSLKSQKSKSCGCLRKEKLLESVVFDDLSGKIFDYLTVIERVGSKKYPGGGQSQMYKCRCICGNESIVARSMLVSGFTTSCGCRSESKLERWTKNVLLNQNFEFEQQYTFDDLLGIKNHCLRFDFAIKIQNKIIGLIECQGEQHYRSVDYFGGDEKFKIRQDHDARKRKYALDHNIPELELPYYLTKEEFERQLNNFLYLLKSENRSVDVSCNEKWSNGFQSD